MEDSSEIYSSAQGPYISLERVFRAQTKVFHFPALCVNPDVLRPHAVLFVLPPTRLLVVFDLFIFPDLDVKEQLVLRARGTRAGRNKNECAWFISAAVVAYKR